MKELNPKTRLQIRVRSSFTNLKITGDNKMQAAKLLSMKRTTLVEHIIRMKLEEEFESKDGKLPKFP